MCAWSVSMGVMNIVTYRHQHPFTQMRWGREGGGGGGNLRCLDPWQVLYKPLLGAKSEKTKRIWCVRSLFFAYSKCTAFSDLHSLFFFCVENTVFSHKCDPWHDTHLMCFVWLQTIAPMLVERMRWRQFTAQWGDGKNLELRLWIWLLPLLLSLLLLLCD